LISSLQDPTNLDHLIGCQETKVNYPPVDLDLYNYLKAGIGIVFSLQPQIKAKMSFANVQPSLVEISQDGQGLPMKL
jgi:hypothetical protein